MDRDTVTAKPDLRALQNAAIKTPEEIVTDITAFIGPKITMLIAGIKDPRTLENWKQPGATIPEVQIGRLQKALASALVLSDKYKDPRQIASWFTWLSDSLDDISPASYLRKANDLEDVEKRGRKVVSAARQYIADCFPDDTPGLRLPSSARQPTLREPALH